MAKYRQVQVSFWQDGFVLSLPPEEKYFYLYLMTNSKTTQCGIYELPLKVIEMETGLTSDRIFDLIQTFIRYKKIRYNEETREIMLLNWLKHNSLKSPKVMSCVEKEMSAIKYIPYISEFKRLSIQYGYSINTPSIDLGEEEEEKEEQKGEREEEKKAASADPYLQVIDGFCKLHNKLDIHLKFNERDDAHALLNMGIPAGFILSTIKKIHKQRTEKGEKITSLSYYKNAICEAWKGEKANEEFKGLQPNGNDGTDEEPTEQVGWLPSKYNTPEFLDSLPKVSGQ